MSILGEMYIEGYRTALERYSGQGYFELALRRDKAREMKRALPVGSPDWHGMVGIITALNILMGEN